LPFVTALRPLRAASDFDGLATDFMAILTSVVEAILTARW
jgi:hypothetical protein